MSRRLVVWATLRTPYGNTARHHIDPAGHPVRPGVKVAFAGARDLWKVLSLDVPEELPRGYDYWTVTKVVS